MPSAPVADDAKDLTLSAFDFELPAHCIAQHPVSPRDAARMLVVGRDALADRVVGDLPDLLEPGDLMLFNDTRVIPARLSGKRGEATIEVTLHRRMDADCWRAFARPAKRLKTGQDIHFADGFSARVTDKLEGGEVELRFDRAGAALFAALETHGVMPLPPYIRRPRDGDGRDRDDYQTLFAEKQGAVAAPTAGLHFTPALMDALARRGVETARLTLHVGAGTFLPVKTERPVDHKMHFEWGEITRQTADAVNAARARGGRIIATGTTCLRLLESAAAPDGHLEPFSGETDLFILPGHRFRLVDRLLTNFHLPKSTLFMLVSAFSGLNRMQGAYAHAIASGYRFYSYGDCCLLERMDDRTESQS